MRIFFITIVFLFFPLLAGCGNSTTGENLPKILSISTNTGKPEGPVSGGTSVTITGINFGHDSEVFFGENQAASVTFQNSRQLLATTRPVFLSGRVTVTVTTGSQIDVAPSAFLYTPLVAFSSNRTGPFDIFTMAIDGTEIKKITNNALGDLPQPDLKEINDVPAFSPDGKEIVFESNKTGNREIFIAGRTGTTPTNLTQNAAADNTPSFSPDGNFIVFSSNRHDPASNPTSDPEIFRIKRDGTALQQLTFNTSREFEPAYSPDGTRIVFVSERNRLDTDLYIIDSADGGNEIQITGSPENDSSPTFSPDGTQILFVREQNNAKELYAVKNDGTNLIQLTLGQANVSDPAFVTQRDNALNIVFSKEAAAKPEIFIITCRGSSTFFVLSCDETSVKNLSDHVNTDNAPSPSP